MQDVELSTAPLIKTIGLSHSYGSHAGLALDMVDLEVPKGASLGLLGPNGAGKSTLISLMTGVVPRIEGDILINGISIDKQDHALKDMSALAPQELAFYPRLSIEENLSFFGGAYGLTGKQYRRQRDQSVEICKLGSLMKRRSDHLSGGEKRRLNLAIALLNDPDVLYLDEPTVGIDARSRRTILEAISALNRAGTTIIYTSHYMEEVEAVCDRIAVINQGRIILNASVAELVARSKEPKARLFTAGPLSDDQSAALAAENVQMLTPRELSVPAADAMELSKLLNLSASLGVHIERIDYGVGKLEDIYLDVLRRSEAQT